MFVIKIESSQHLFFKDFDVLFLMLVSYALGIIFRYNQDSPKRFYSPGSQRNNVRLIFQHWTLNYVQCSSVGNRFMIVCLFCWFVQWNDKHYTLISEMIEPCVRKRRRNWHLPFHCAGATHRSCPIILDTMTSVAARLRIFTQVLQLVLINLFLWW